MQANARMCGRFENDTMKVLRTAEDTDLNSLRFKIHDNRPGLRPFQFCTGADGETRTHTAFATTPSRWRVYQFHHVGSAKTEGPDYTHIPSAGEASERSFLKSYLGTSSFLTDAGAAGVVGAVGRVTGAVLAASITLPDVRGALVAM